MTGDPIYRAPADDLLRRQDALQAEAADVLADLDLFEGLSRAGEVTQVGSSAAGLMVGRDIDICVVCDTWNSDVAFEAVRPLASHPRVYRLNFWNQTGAFNPHANLTDGYYWGVEYRAEAGEEWKLDLWFWSRGAPPADVEHLQELKRRLTPETRLAIVWIKDVHHRLHPYSEHDVSSIDIYDAVLDHGVRSPSEFGAYLASRPEHTDGA